MLRLSRENGNGFLNLPDEIDALFEEAPRPTVIVMKTARLEKLLRSKGIGGRITSMKERNTSKGLSQYFKGRKPVALNGNYGVAAKLSNSLEEFLRKPVGKGDSSIHFLGVSADVFDELAAQSPGYSPGIQTRVIRLQDFPLPRIVSCPPCSRSKAGAGSRPPAARSIGRQASSGRSLRIGNQRIEDLVQIATGRLADDRAKSLGRDPLVRLG